MEMTQKRTGETIPRILLTAPKSGSGKTLITCGMIEVFRRRGRKPAAFKCGPDYIDPMFHRYVSGVGGANLDSFFLDEAGVRRVLTETVSETESGSCVMEGVMGYYDGVSGTELTASTYDIARITRTPAILIVDAKGASRSLVPLISGFLHYPKESDAPGQRGSGIAGVILNRTTAMMAKILGEMIRNECGIPVLGFLPESEDWKMESRHLGLFLPHEISDLRRKIGLLADQMEKSFDMDAIFALADGSEPVETEAIAEKEQTYIPETSQTRVRIAAAVDEAFCFYYQENRRMMEKMGAEIVPFSPIHDTKLPEGIAGLILEGGYPELFARELSENHAMLAQIRAVSEQSMPILAECGGFMYLHEEMEGADGNRYPAVGVIRGRTFRMPKLGRFGYISLAGPHSDKIRGHEYHYWDSTDCGGDWTAVKPNGRSWNCIHDRDGMIAGFPHFYYPSDPDFVEQWLAMCRNWRNTDER
ncbi:MAG: cobyrinate a,c-diamide synthase [Bacillota bacterium]|nr:cobyrinate a,c-diamide synthase [Bacillota bacterium]